MTGWRGRIGVIQPSDGVLDAEFWRLAPPGVSVLLTRSRASVDFGLHLSASERQQLMAESPDLEACARTFRWINAACVAYACTSASFSRGPGYDAEIIGRIREAARCPAATTTTTGAVTALRALGIRRLAVAAPYRDDSCARLRRFFEGAGFEIVNLANLGLDTLEIGAVPPEEVYALGHRVMVPEADGLFIACTNFRGVEVIEPLEHDFGKPVVSANQATIWHALQVAGIAAQLEGVGRLYRLPRSAAAELQPV
jgi:maleate isomerase